MHILLISVYCLSAFCFSGIIYYFYTINKLQEEKQKLQDEKSDLTSQLNTCNTNKGNFERDLNTCNTDKGNFERDLSACNTNKGNFERDLNTCRNEKTNLTSQLSTCNTDKGNFQRDLGTCNGLKTTAENNLNTCNGLKLTAENNLRDCNGEKTRIQGLLDNSSGTQTTLEIPVLFSIQMKNIKINGNRSQIPVSIATEDDALYAEDKDIFYEFEIINEIFNNIFTYQHILFSSDKKSCMYFRRKTVTKRDSTKMTICVNQLILRTEMTQPFVFSETDKTYLMIYSLQPPQYDVETELFLSPFMTRTSDFETTETTAIYKGLFGVYEIIEDKATANRQKIDQTFINSLVIQNCNFYNKSNLAHITRSTFVRICNSLSNSFGNENFDQCSRLQLYINNNGNSQLYNSISLQQSFNLTLNNDGLIQIKERTLNLVFYQWGYVYARFLKKKVNYEIYYSLVRANMQHRLIWRGRNLTHYPGKSSSVQTPIKNEVVYEFGKNEITDDMFSTTTTTKDANGQDVITETKKTFQPQNECFSLDVSISRNQQFGFKFDFIYDLSDNIVNAGFIIFSLGIQTLYNTELSKVKTSIPAFHSSWFTLTQNRSLIAKYLSALYLDYYYQSGTTISKYNQISVQQMSTQFFNKDGTKNTIYYTTATSGILKPENQDQKVQKLISKRLFFQDYNNFQDTETRLQLTIGNDGGLFLSKVKHADFKPDFSHIMQSTAFIPSVVEVTDNYPRNNEAFQTQNYHQNQNNQQINEKTVDKKLFNPTIRILRH